jgi:hypothetical protein
VCGDAYAVRGERSLSLMLCDGSGHGPLAASAYAAARTFRDPTQPVSPPEVAVARIDRLLNGTRGGAVAVAELDPAAGLVRFVGVGNITAAVVSGADKRGMVPPLQASPGTQAHHPRLLLPPRRRRDRHPAFRRRERALDAGGRRRSTEQVADVDRRPCCATSAAGGTTHAFSSGGRPVISDPAVLLPQLRIASENDVFLARQRGREIAALIGFENQDQVRCTALSRLSRELSALSQPASILPCPWSPRRPPPC